MSITYLDWIFLNFFLPRPIFSRFPNRTFQTSLKSFRRIVPLSSTFTHHYRFVENVLRKSAITIKLSQPWPQMQTTNAPPPSNRVGGLVSPGNSFRQQLRRCLRKYNPSAVLDRKKEQDPTGSWSALISCGDGNLERASWFGKRLFVLLGFVLKSCILCYFYVFRILLLWLFWNSMDISFEIWLKMNFKDEMFEVKNY